MKFLSYKLLNIDEKGIKFEAIFDTEKLTKFISSNQSSRDIIQLDSKGKPIKDKQGRIMTYLEKFDLYNPQDSKSIDKCIKEWADAYLTGKRIEEERKTTPSKEVKNLIGKVQKV